MAQERFSIDVGQNGAHMADGISVIRVSQTFADHPLRLSGELTKIERIGSRCGLTYPISIRNIHLLRSAT
ncbi:hypothetical protein EMIT0P74_10323 [Pseudomonas sp. IT-P74]